MLLFLLKANIALTLFYLAYRFGLRRLTFYTLNRVFLLLAIICAAVCPFINPETIFRHKRPFTGAAMGYVINFNDLRQPATPWFNVVLIYIFWAGVIVMTLRLLMQLSSLWVLHRSSRKDKVFEQQVRVTDQSLQPFSFLHNIYINPGMHSPTELPDIMRHEQVHVRQWHTLDVLLSELNKIFYWFNPGAWLISIAIRENLEFITDRYVLRQGADIKDYQYSLLKVSGIPYATAIANNFNFSHLKQRIMMMNKKRSSKYNLVRYIVLGSIMIIALVSLNYTRAAITVTVKNALRADTGVTPPPPPPAPPMVQEVPDGKVPPPPPPRPPKAPKAPKGAKEPPAITVDVHPAPAPKPMAAPAPPPPPPADSLPKIIFRSSAGSNMGIFEASKQPEVYVDNQYKGKTMPAENTDIKSVFVFKDDNVPAEYGEDARKSGLILIFTKDYNGPEGAVKEEKATAVMKVEGNKVKGIIKDEKPKGH
ncbi:M56 family metallopeptidase [Chitinophaga sancti]|uniref:M56 family metallopeptidase n=1 Tax=Chitinophaga sancti TaxID=1004 RepID=UPI003F78E127